MWSLVAVVMTMAGALGMSMGWGIVVSDDLGTGDLMWLSFEVLRNVVGEMCIFIVCALLYV